jgi:hypothetical protein
MSWIEAIYSSVKGGRDFSAARTKPDAPEAKSTANRKIATRRMAPSPY